jgi:hypothetical protein
VFPSHGTASIAAQLQFDQQDPILLAGVPFKNWAVDLPFYDICLTHVRTVNGNNNNNGNYQLYNCLCCNTADRRQDTDTCPVQVLYNETTPTSGEDTSTIEPTAAPTRTPGHNKASGIDGALSTAMITIMAAAFLSRQFIQ